MSDGEQGGPSAVFPGTTTLAALTTILLATGSALLIRSKRSSLSLSSSRIDVSGDCLEDAHAVSRNEQLNATTPTNDSKDTKNPRTKERRRRGKDPVKEILKGSKRGKLLLKHSKAADDINFVGEHANAPSSAESGTHPSPSVMQTPTTTPGQSRDASLSYSKSSSSASVSSLSSERRESDARPRSDDTRTPQARRDSFNDEPETSRSRGTSLVASSSRSVSADPPVDSTYTTLPSDMSPTSPRSTDSSTPSVSTPTPPNFFTDIVGPQAEAQELPSPPSLEANIFHKPPRMSATNSPPPLSSSIESSPALHLSASLPLSFHGLSSSYDPSPSCSPPSSLSSVSLASSSSAANHEEEMPPISFPSLNPQPPPNGSLSFAQRSVPASSVSSPKPSPKLPAAEYDHGNGASSNTRVGQDSANMVGNSRNGRQGHTPRRTPTPSSQSSGTHTPPPSLSAQTQIASLRGALEAARLREDKMKSEMEKRARDFEALRWESVAWRQREAELQNQILHLTHHLQAYTTYHNSMSPQALPPSLPAPHHPQHLNMSIKTQQYRVSNTPSPVPSPTRHLASAQMNGMLSPMPSPLSQTTPNSHMFPYSATPSPSAANHNIPSPYISSPPAPPSSLFSVLFPFAGASNGSAAGPSRSGGSSVGSLSPELGGSSSSSLQPTLNRGRQRSRFWNGGDAEDWIDTSSSSQNTPKEPENTGEEELNSVLADAILKRPDSIRRGASHQSVGAGEGRSEGVCMVGVEEEASTEFTFPSLSDFGQGKHSSRTGTRSPDGGSSATLSNGDDGSSESWSAATEAQQQSAEAPVEVAGGDGDEVTRAVGAGDDLDTGIETMVDEHPPG
ncbi:hypothetical protein ONZ45_g11226 [Pleurotus djamor]|nr:hypothetical protein ONZ45_g11226 [Pleurotus djamor]